MNDFILAGFGFEFRYKVGIGQEPDIDDHVRVGMGPPFKSKGYHIDRHTGDGLIFLSNIQDGKFELVNAEVGGVDDMIGFSAQMAQQFALFLDGCDQAATVAQGVAPTRLAETLDKNRFVGIQEYGLDLITLFFKVFSGIAELQ